MPEKASTDTQHVSALALSPEDIKRLLEDGSTQTRVDITNKIAGAYSFSQLHPSEFKIAEQIFRLLLRDTELRVRTSLAQHIKNSTTIPRDIVLAMSRDVDSVSLPIIQFSEVFTDEDLVELVKSSHDVTRFLAVSKRRVVSEVVSNALLQKDNEQVAAALVGNSGAEIGEDDLVGIVSKYNDNEGFMEALGNRPRLPIAAAEKLLSVVSESLAESLKQKYHLAKEVISQEAAQSHESEALQLVKNVEDDASIEALVAQMQSSGRLSPSVILSALCQGNFAFFEASLARLSNIPVKNARLLITDKGDLGFRALYNKSGLTDSMLPAIRLLLKVVRELAAEGQVRGKSRYANAVVERILRYSEEEPIENLSYIIALVRRSVQ